MSLFPAYAPDSDECLKVEQEKDRSSQRNIELSRAEEFVFSLAEEAQEATLLASDASDEEATPSAPSPVQLDDSFYLDGKADNANLGVTTLYYPGRPIYERASAPVLGGGRGGGRGGGEGGEVRRRYYLQRVPAPAPDAPRVAERARAMRRLLDDRPQDEELWLQFIEFQEAWAGSSEWRAACEQAVARGAGGARVRSALHRARRASLPPGELLRALEEDVARERCERRRLEAWLRLLWAAPAEELQDAARRALLALPHSARAYPLVLYVYGSSLAAAGLWEQLVLLLELVCALNYPPSEFFPPPPTSEEEARVAECRLQKAEDTVIESGLPLSTVWVRVERLRAAAHWRAPAPGRRPEPGAGADPQRAPHAAEAQALLHAARPGAALLLSVALLRLAQAPLLPASEAAKRAAGAGAEEAAEGAGAALVALARAARRLPAPAPAPDAAALRAALHALLDPPHCFCDEAGYLSWQSALWEACCGWAQGEARLALACWRLRWLHALARAAPAAEARRLLAQARRAVKRHAPRDPLAYALFARIEADAGDEAAARRAALQAVRAACGAADVARPHALFAARVLHELAGAAGAGAGAGAQAQWALCAAARGLPLPPDAALQTPPAPRDLQDALLECSKQCEEMEMRFATQARGAEGQAGEEEEEADAGVARALTCGPGEWSAARVRLLPPPARAAELARVLAQPHALVHLSAESVQYWEAGACALAAGAAGAAGVAGAARQLLPLFPNNALLALASSGSSVWSRARGAPAPAPRTHPAAFALVLQPLLRAPLHTATVAELKGVKRACERAAARGAGGATLCALRLEVQARLPARPEPLQRLLLAALQHHPDHKWVYVRGAQWASADAAALCQAALERGLRVHALMEELRPLTVAPTPATPAPPAPACEPAAGDRVH